MVFSLLHTALAVQSKCLIGGQGYAGMRPERRFKPGMDGGFTAASLLSSPPLYLRTAELLSKRWGPPQDFGTTVGALVGAGIGALLPAGGWKAIYDVR